eukprot:TRINITY_DN13237_c0_g1_i1.p1 TRINITY_DN13237_c0_g1~~TRINITY_DN13237_c0_g1_i1.p1  ORF type:complete len:372 (-),score=149.09 TRINITY_DN13237_c0_g1_i1:38-1123(-)
MFRQGQGPAPSQTPVPFDAAEEQKIGYLLQQRLGKEFVVTRPGAGGTKFTYLESWKAISLANQIFGFNGWSCTIADLNVDYSEEIQGKYHVGVTAIVRVTLRDGTSHEDIGFGSGENPKKLGAIELAKKEAVSDARKRALRLFGDALGNCLYDKDHLKRVKSQSSYAPTAGFLQTAMVEEYGMYSSQMSASQAPFDPSQAIAQAEEEEARSQRPSQPITSPPPSSPRQPSPSPSASASASMATSNGNHTVPLVKKEVPSIGSVGAPAPLTVRSGSNLTSPRSATSPPPSGGPIRTSPATTATTATVGAPTVVPKAPITLKPPQSRSPPPLKAPPSPPPAAASAQPMQFFEGGIDGPFHLSF